MRTAKRGIAAVCVMMAAMPAYGAKQEAPHEYGPPPMWSDYKQLGEQAISAMLVDPSSAQFQWTHGYHQGGWKPFLSAKVYGYVACGYINAKNRMGGYAGTKSFVVVIDRGQVLYADMSRSTGDYVDLPCIKAAEAGTLPPIDTMPDKPVASTAAFFSYELVPAGLRVTSVERSSSAEKAGITPGTIVMAVNGMPLASVPAAAVKQILSSASTLKLLTVDGATLVVQKP